MVPASTVSRYNLAHIGEVRKNRLKVQPLLAVQCSHSGLALASALRVNALN